MPRYSEADIERAIRTVATLINRFGDAYWPILERLERELQARRSRAARLQQYLGTNERLGMTPCDLTVETAPAAPDAQS